MKLTPTLFLALGLTLAARPQTPAVHPKFGFPIYTNAPSGKQLAGQWVAASNPALSPADERKSFAVPPGFQVRLFASEPEVVNPVAMSFDERGRLWVLELYEYPLGAKPGAKGRDRIKILEDTDDDGVADKVTVFADGMSLATGLLVANGGVYVGEAPHLWFMRDTNGDDVADEKTEVLTGFGLEDRHELLNGFTWGPDGQLYMTHGVFTATKAKDPNDPKAEPVVVSAGVARLNTRTKKFEVFAEGTSNPWGVDFDAKGNAFVSACVIDHLFHLAPGGIYARQAGQPPYPYAYELLPSIVDHKHHMAAYAGIDIYQGDQWPAEWRGAALQGNIHQNAINLDRLTPKGSSFSAGRWNDSGDFLTTKDGWFMPVSTQTGPDGAVWVMDWYDKYPCYQNANADPDGVDRERGRIWRVVWVGDDANKKVPSHPAGLNLARLPSSELVGLLAHPNVWHRRQAQRVLNGRKDVAGERESLVELYKTGKSLDSRLAAFWTIFSTGLMDDALLDQAANDKDAAVRMWAARFTGERHEASSAALDRLAQLARDNDPTVRSAVATAARQFVSGQLTVNTPTGFTEAVPIGPVLVGLIEASKAGDDRTVNLLTWLAAEPAIMKSPKLTCDWFAENGRANMPLSGRLAAKTLRRFCDAHDPALLDLAVQFLDALPEDSASFTAAALGGLIEGQRGKAVTPTVPTDSLIKKLLASANADLAAKARELGTLWGDASALKSSLAKITDPSATEADRLAGIRVARTQRGEDVRATLLGVITSANPEPIRLEAVRALADAGDDNTARRLLAGWGEATPAVRRAVAELCTTRSQWRWDFLNAVQRGDVKRGDISPTVIRTLATAKDDNERAKAQQLFGRVNASSAEKLKLIAQKRKVVTAGAVDLAAGHEVAKRTCFVCHKLYGEGAEIGPDLTGVGRSSLDALLHNVINPNEIIGQGYENVEVETKDDRSLSGRMVENTDRVVKLVMAGPHEEVIAKADIKSLRVTENSVMPEGLEQMPDADFRNLIWFILAPPQDGKPLTDERRRELMGGSGEQSSADPLGVSDGEGVALWNPEWRVECPPFEGAPRKYPEFAGRANVLMTHPADKQTPAALVKKLTLPAGRKATLRFRVAAHERGDWELRVRADGELLHKETITHDGARWKDVALDLSQFGGRMVVLRLENAANDWSWEFGYWADLRIEMADVAAR
jgi:putative membrane-bound dehydrogenase-like protein